MAYILPPAHAKGTLFEGVSRCGKGKSHLVFMKYIFKVTYLSSAMCRKANQNSFFSPFLLHCSFRLPLPNGNRLVHGTRGLQIPVCLYMLKPETTRFSNLKKAFLTSWWRIIKLQAVKFLRAGSRI
jgi:hypothetical protein